MSGRRLEVDKLTQEECQGAYENGRTLWDGRGLRLRHGRYWQLRYWWEGKGCQLSLGTFPEVGLEEARAATLTAKAHLKAGRDPRAMHHQQQAEDDDSDDLSGALLALAGALLALSAPLQDLTDAGGPARDTPPAPADMDTVAAAAYIGSNDGTMRNWRAQGKGPPYIEVVGNIRYRRVDLDEWLNAHRVVPGQTQQQ